jgi:hypothetical protein
LGSAALGKGQLSKGNLVVVESSKAENYSRWESGAAYVETLVERELAIAAEPNLTLDLVYSSWSHAYDAAAAVLTWLVNAMRHHQTMAEMAAAVDLPRTMAAEDLALSCCMKFVAAKLADNRTAQTPDSTANTCTVARSVSIAAWLVRSLPLLGTLLS